MPSEANLRRLLGRGDVLAIAFGAMVGWSWVVLAGEMIVRAGAVGSILAFGAGAVMVWLVGLTYAELSAALSRAGGEISFTFVAFGPAGAFACGWTLVLAYVAVCAFEAVALPTVLSHLVPGFEVARLYQVAGWDVHASWVIAGVAGTLAIGVVNYRGIRFAAFAQRLAVGGLLLVGLAFFLPGSVHGDTANLAPLITGWEGVLRVVIMTPFLYVGFDVIPQLAEEIDVPLRTVGRVIVLSIVMALGWYGLVQWTVGLSLDPATLTDRALPTADAMSAVYGSEWAGRVLVIGGAFGILTSWNAFFLGASRLLFAMARGGMLPAVFARLHPRYGSPAAVVVVLTGITTIAPFFGRPALVWLVDAGSLATVVAYLFVAAAFLVIRRRHPDLPRPYRVAAPAVVGWLAVAATVFFILLYLPGSPSALVWPEEWAIVLLWMVLGAVLATGIRSRVATLGAARQARLILGDQLHVLARRR
ncbi:MAG: amino acid permease [Acidobacteria bacterium]|nr:amino acid permease [Acidobacteriota bacterium]MYD72235.1 amino acid permease [Acidobacteriota bacterium]MYJ04082.1 amino acid permease [Acidobacteriota bacterium]